MLDDWDFATRFRDVIVEVAESVVERVRPGHRYAKVMSIDRANRKCTVHFPGEPGDVVVPMGSIQPAQVGQIVRIAGSLGDRYIDDVMGQAVMMGSTPIGATVNWPDAIAVPSGYLTANGAYLDPATYPSLFAVYGYTLGQQGNLFRIPSAPGQIVRAA